MDLQQQKSALRQVIRQIRKKIPVQQKEQSDRQIYHNVVQLPEYQAAKTLFIFVATLHEINTWPIIEHAWQTGKVVGVPLCTSKGVMEIRAITSSTDLTPGMLGIMEPVPHTILIDKKTVDFAVIPCLSVTPNGARLGQGGGYYDRFLVNRTYRAAAVCREQLVLKDRAIPMEAFDVPVDMIVTETEVIRIATV